MPSVERLASNEVRAVYFYQNFASLSLSLHVLSCDWCTYVIRNHKLGFLLTSEGVFHMFLLDFYETRASCG